MPRKNKENQGETASQKEEVYNPGEIEQKVLTEAYTTVLEMIQTKDKGYPEINNRTLKAFWNDGDKRVNAHVTPRENYDPPKESWQSNLPLSTIRDKQEKTLAGYSLSVPDMTVKAFGENNFMDVNRAEVSKALVIGSYQQEENSVIENFWESWECATKGTVIKYEGYLKTKYKRKFVTKYDIVTGKVEYTEKEVNVDDKCISYLVPLSEFFVRDFYIHDIQDEPEIAWIRYLDEDVFDYEFGKYEKSKLVKTRVALADADTNTFYYKQKDWQERTKGKSPIEVIRLYNRIKDTYLIIANGVLLLEAPLLWNVNGTKVYPFAKTIFKPFVNKQFFWGNSFPNIMAGIYDSFNTTFNTMADKQWRSMMPGMLVGRVNQDAMDLEDEIISGSTHIHVEDVNQVKPVPVDGVNQADVLFFRMIAQLIADSAPSLPDVMANKNATAREIVIANQKLAETKVLYTEMIKDLWRQKYALRLANIQMNYPRPRKIAETDKNGKIKETLIYRTYIIDDVVLDPITGERGMLAVQFRNVPAKQAKKVKEETSIEEAMMKQQGVAYKKLILPENYLDNYRYQMEIMDQAILKQSQGMAQAVILEKLGVVQKMFPQIFALQQNDYYEELAKAYGDNPQQALKKLAQLEELRKTVADQQAKQAQEGGGSEMGPERQPGARGEGQKEAVGAGVGENRMG